jgi:hypothetical protein
MLRDTCPEDLEIDDPPMPRPAPLWMMLGLPVGLCVLVVLVAWLHAALGSPLGPAFASEMWGLARMAIASTVAAGAFGVWARRQNETNLAELRQARRDVAALSASALPRVRQTGPHRVLQTGRHRIVEAEVEDEDEEGGPW